ncbi:histidine phosphatase family protein [Streptomyces sp. NPDC048269]|uniref:SixA phosphatase family protein n=1 Tax=Streptomyces sp. NPDC048269 TaxID=3155753 RepID=UPI00341BD796
MSRKDERTLVLVRHGKAVPKDVDEDFDRALADRGRHDAPEAGQWLAASGVRADLALCSPSRRTRQTWQLMVPQLSEPPPTTYEDRLYKTGPDELRAALAETDDGVAGLVLVGHNPGIHELARTLCGDGPKHLVRRIHDGFPTAAVVVLELAGSWKSLTAGAGRPTAIWAPGD